MVVTLVEMMVEMKDVMMAVMKDVPMVVWMAAEKAY